MHAGGPAWGAAKGSPKGEVRNRVPALLASVKGIYYKQCKRAVWARVGDGGAEGGPGKQVTTTGVGPGNIFRWK